MWYKNGVHLNLSALSGFARELTSPYSNDLIYLKKSDMKGEYRCEVKLRNGQRVASADHAPQGYISFFVLFFFVF